ncbi:MAG: hypothetical protein PVG14_09170 [Anaerolineales bacterium]
MAKIDLPKRKKERLYAASHLLDKELEIELGLQIPFDVYLQDPHVAETDPRFGFDENFYIKWEPGLADGPTSARFAIVDYNADTQRIAAPAEWDEGKLRFVKGRRVLDRRNIDNFQFHQVNVWAALQRALDFYQSGFGLGRPIPWGFKGNRLIVVPHAGYGENAFYDRKSKSLQFYYFERDSETIYTCLSTDIINHEFGHAVLDGIRPHFMESVSVQTAAFHEFIGDLTAILIILRNNEFRGQLADMTSGDLSEAEHLANIAEQFGKAVQDKPYLRNANSELTLEQVEGDQRPHHVSQVLTGAMYDIIKKISHHFLKERGRTPKQAFWNTIQRMQRTAIQPLDLLPPADVTFRDYALAVLRAEELSNPKDPHGYYQILRDAFHQRGILEDADIEELEKPHYLYERLRMSVYHDIDHISRSRSAAYLYLNDNREELYIPPIQDFIVADLYVANKFTRQARRLPKQIILEYIWREEVKLDGPEFGRYNGQTTSMLCGGTLVFDENGNVLSWFRKPGTQVRNGKDWEQEVEAGESRRQQLLEAIARKIKKGKLGLIEGGQSGLIGARIPPNITRKVDGALIFELSPHLRLADEDAEEQIGERQWQISF